MEAYDAENREELGPSVSFATVRMCEDGAEPRLSAVAAEVPVTIIANDVELATLSCTPCELREFVCGFLYTSGFISAAVEMQEFHCDPLTWRVTVHLPRTPDPAFLGQRLYTSGCGKGVMYTNVVEMSLRYPLDNDLLIPFLQLQNIMQWLQKNSELHRQTGGVHSAALATVSQTATRSFDDIGRHNAVDKVIGHGLLQETDFSRMLLVCTGRISAEILFKARRAAVPVLASLSAPTHQAVLLARKMKMTLAGFARGRSMTVFAGEQRITCTEN